MSTRRGAGLAVTALAAVGLLLAAFLALGTASGAGPVARAAYTSCTPETGGSPPGGTADSAAAQQIVAAVNQARAQQTAQDGIPRPALTVNGALAASSLWKATNLAVDDYWAPAVTWPSGSSPHDDYRWQAATNGWVFLRRWYQRELDCGYPSGYVEMGENIAAGYAGVQAVMAGWLSSCEHETNIMDGNFTETGVALVRITTDVAGRLSPWGSYYSEEFGAVGGTDNPALRVDFCSHAAPTATPSPTLSPTPTATASPTAIPSPTPTPTASPSATPTPTASPAASSTPTPAPTTASFSHGAGFYLLAWQGPALASADQVVAYLNADGLAGVWQSLYEPVDGTTPLEWQYLFPQGLSRTVSGVRPGQVVALYLAGDGTLGWAPVSGGQ